MRAASRTAGPAPGPAFEEAVNALGDVVRRHGEISVTVTVEEHGGTWTARVFQHDDGRVMASLQSLPRHAEPTG